MHSGTAESARNKRRDRVLEMDAVFPGETEGGLRDGSGTKPRDKESGG